MANVVYTLTDSVLVDATDSNGVVVITQVGDTTATISTISDKVFRIVRPSGHIGALRFLITVTADGPETSQVFEVFPIDHMKELVLGDGDADDFSSWT